jgi:hypothetical protein
MATGASYLATPFPATYRGAPFFSERISNGSIKYVPAGGPSTWMFDPQVGSVVDLSVAPDGSLYYLADGPAVAKASASVTEGVGPLAVQFSSAGTSSPERRAE